MDAAGLVERAKAGLDRIEKLMLSSPEMIELLKVDHILALRELATPSEAVVEQQRPPTPDELWEFWRDCKIRGRRDMSARMKAKAVRWYGPMYKQLPW